MYRRYGDRARFLTIYIKEAHPEDEWQMTANEKEDVCYPQPKTLEQRVRIANDFVRRFRYEIPLAVDRMDNRADQLYAGWPERFYILDERGTIAYKGKTGPFGYHPEEVEQWLARRFPPLPLGEGRGEGRTISRKPLSPLSLRERAG
jgi:type I thyroxine 5'-deiodinase